MLRVLARQAAPRLAAAASALSVLSAAARPRPTAVGIGAGRRWQSVAANGAADVSQPEGVAPRAETPAEGVSDAESAEAAAGDAAKPTKAPRRTRIAAPEDGPAGDFRKRIISARVGLHSNEQAVAWDAWLRFRDSGDKELARLDPMTIGYAAMSLAGVALSQRLERRQNRQRMGEEEDSGTDAMCEEAADKLGAMLRDLGNAGARIPRKSVEILTNAMGHRFRRFEVCRDYFDWITSIGLKLSPAIFDEVVYNMSRSGNYTGTLATVHYGLGLNPGYGMSGNLATSLLKALDLMEPAACEEVPGYELNANAGVFADLVLPLSYFMWSRRSQNRRWLPNKHPFEMAPDPTVPLREALAKLDSAPSPTDICAPGKPKGSGTVVDKVIEILTSFFAAGGTMDVYVLASAVEVLLRARAPRAAFALVDIYTGAPHFVGDGAESSSYLYTRLLRDAGRRSDAAALRQVTQKLAARNRPPDLPLLTALLQVSIDLRNFERANQIYNSVPNLNLGRSDMLELAYLEAVVQNPPSLPEGAPAPASPALAHFDKLRAQQLPVSPRLYAKALLLHADRREPDAVEGVWQDMSDRSIALDARMVATLAKFYAIRGDMEAVMQLAGLLAGTAERGDGGVWTAVAIGLAKKLDSMGIVAAGRPEDPHYAMLKGMWDAVLDRKPMEEAGMPEEFRERLPFAGVRPPSLTPGIMVVAVSAVHYHGPAEHVEAVLAQLRGLADAQGMDHSKMEMRELVINLGGVGRFNLRKREPVPADKAPETVSEETLESILV
ncbi:hypothetical protein DFJ74DRAFT_766314 [Hyaloraphidium curvatum]|nr:hypothetical protein DFJ74DRAFT_766314 [Hyaloraphidium curvatum]